MKTLTIQEFVRAIKTNMTLCQGGLHCSSSGAGIGIHCDQCPIRNECRALDKMVPGGRHTPNVNQLILETLKKNNIADKLDLI